MQILHNMLGGPELLQTHIDKIVLLKLTDLFQLLSKDKHVILVSRFQVSQLSHNSRTNDSENK